MGLRDLPSVDNILKSPDAADIISRYGHTITVEAIRFFFDDFRRKYNPDTPIPTHTQVLAGASKILNGWLRPTLQPVINASGVILHTNLGRAPLSVESLEAIQEVSIGYCTLEYDLAAGKRGSRSTHAENLLTRLTGAESALVVNNNAAAVLLTLSALAARRQVVISRSQLVEIGGGFRIPDVMRQSGARLVEVGTTNRVHLDDYEKALQEPTALLLRAHHSNFRIIGFTTEPELSELVKLANRYNIPVMDDLGSGTLIDTRHYGLSHEPMVQESIAAGAKIICFSGDKLLGGPQAGIIIGDKEYLAKIKKHPLARAVRADKLCLAALSATLLHYLKGEAESKIPIWRMISQNQKQIQKRAERWISVIGAGTIINSFSTIGGGSLPEEQIPTSVLCLDIQQPDKFMARLRELNPPVIARIESDKVIFDPRTVLPEQEDALLVLLRLALNDFMNAFEKKARINPGEK